MTYDVTVYDGSTSSTQQVSIVIDGAADPFIVTPVTVAVTDTAQYGRWPARRQRYDRRHCPRRRFEHPAHDYRGQWQRRQCRHAGCRGLWFARSQRGRHLRLRRECCDRSAAGRQQSHRSVHLPGGRWSGQYDHDHADVQRHRRRRHPGHHRGRRAGHAHGRCRAHRCGQWRLRDRRPYRLDRQRRDGRSDVCRRRTRQLLRAAVRVGFPGTGCGHHAPASTIR